MSPVLFPFRFNRKTPAPVFVAVSELSHVVPTGGGVAAGVTLLDGLDGGLVPAEFEAVTVNVYGVPFVSSVTTSGDADPVLVLFPGDEVTVKVAPLLFAPGVKLTVARPSPASAVPIVGAPGAVVPRSA